MIFLYYFLLEILTIRKKTYYRPPTKFTCSSNTLPDITSYLLAKRTANKGWVLHTIHYSTLHYTALSC
jgi:hypothetical protein